ncbi:unnamed protein product [Plutella xylostella]|uniref:General transcription factor IIH subunit 1 n=1 Tax=Plutella xylostella TaxID=51655 RepID=A0A8S4GCA3_PLUXY|nr:unnamed protein product [Plutella xylostella]
MTTSSEDVLLSIGYVRYKKGDGTLYVMNQRLAWMLEHRDTVAVSHKYADIKTQKISPAGKPKVQLQVVLHDGTCSTFHFVNPAGAEQQAKDRDQVKMLLQDLLPKFKRQIDGELEMKSKLLSLHPILKHLYEDLVISKVINSEEYWNTPTLKHYTESNSIKQEVGVSGAFLADIQPQTDGCNGLKYNLTQDIIDAIFKTYPAVRKKHIDYVPKKMTEAEFWTKFFQSHYFHRDRIASSSSKDLFGECAKLDDQSIASAMKHTTLDLTKKLLKLLPLLQQGLSQRAVAAQLHLSQSAVSRVYRRFQETGAFNRRPRTGRHRCTSERDDRFIVSTSLRNRHLTGVDVQQELRRVRQVAVSEWTVRRRLKEANLTPKRPASGPKLTAGHRQARLQFAREHLDWSIAQWRSVLFTDECRVCLHGSDRRGRVYRRPGERFAQCCFAETVAYGGGSCMMWAGISLEGKTALVFVPGGGRGGGLTADRYITDILLGHVVPYAEFVGEDFVLMHDNARCHTARVSRQFLREKELRTMDWPALSPDLNPIEHLWDELKRRVRARNPVPASVDELKTALLEEWDGIPQETVKKLISL